MLYGILLSMEKDSRRDLFQTTHSEAVSSLIRTAGEEYNCYEQNNSRNHSPPCSNDAL